MVDWLIGLVGVEGDDVGPHEGLGGAFGGGGVQGNVAAVYVEQLGGRSLLRFADGDFFAGQEVGNFAVGVVHVPGDDGMFGADNDAGRFQADVGAVSAVVAFCGRVCFRINVNSVIGAGLHTGFAADAEAAIEFDNAVFPLVHGFDGTDADAGGVGAVVAACNLEVAAVVGERAGFDIFDPSTINTKRNFVLAFAGSRTGMAANTFAVINNEAVVFGVNAQGNSYWFI